MTHDASHSYTYDAENRLTAVDGGATASYVYDALGRRVKRTVGSNSYEYIYDNDGNIGWELLNGSINRTYIRSNGRLLAEYYQGTTYFIHQDHLGSTRMVTAYPTPTVVECDDYYAYGEANVNVGSCLAATDTTYKFTGLERDSETNLDHTLFRQNSSALGRWMTPDPAGLSVADPTNPQSWNRYSYALNNPLDFTDRSGLVPCPFLASNPLVSNACALAQYQSHLGGDLWGINSSSWDAFDAFTPTGKEDNPDCPNGDCAPQDRFIPVYGDIGLLNLLGDTGSGNDGSGSQNPTKPTRCQVKILNAVNKQFGTNFTQGDVQDTFSNGGAINLQISGSGLPAAQFNSLQMGRYPTSPVTWLTGYGPTLHVTGRSLFDPTASFQNSNIGGLTFVDFTAHIDYGFPFNPFGALYHLFREMLHLGGPRQQC